MRRANPFPAVVIASLLALCVTALQRQGWDVVTHFVTAPPSKPDLASAPAPLRPAPPAVLTTPPQLDAASQQFNSGLALLAQRNYSAAATAFKEATTLNPKMVAAHNNLALAYLGQGLVTEARQALESALRANAATATAFTNLQQLYANLAANEYRKALGGKTTAELPLPTLQLLPSAQPLEASQ